MDLSRKLTKAKTGVASKANILVAKIRGEKGLHIFHDSWLLNDHQAFQCPLPDDPFDEDAWKNVHKSVDNLVGIEQCHCFADFESANDYIQRKSPQRRNEDVTDQLRRIEAGIGELKIGQNVLQNKTGHIKDGVKALVARPTVAPPAGPPIRPAIPQLPPFKIKDEAGYNDLKSALEFARNRDTLLNILRAAVMRFKQHYLAKLFDFMFDKNMIGRIARDEFGPFVGTRVYFAIGEIFAEMKPDSSEQEIAHSYSEFLRRCMKNK